MSAGSIFNVAQTISPQNSDGGAESVRMFHVEVFNALTLYLLNIKMVGQRVSECQPET